MVKFGKLDQHFIDRILEKERGTFRKKWSFGRVCERRSQRLGDGLAQRLDPARPAMEGCVSRLPEVGDAYRTLGGRVWLGAGTQKTVKIAL